MRKQVTSRQIAGVMGRWGFQPLTPKQVGFLLEARTRPLAENNPKEARRFFPDYFRKNKRRPMQFLTPKTSAKNVERAFDLHSGMFSLGYAEEFHGYSRNIQWLLNSAPPGPGEKIVDVGSGIGLVPLVGKRFFPRAKFVGVDISSGMVEQARMLRQRAKERVSFIKCGRQSLPPEAYNADQVWVKDPLDFNTAMGQAHSVLKPGGIVKVIGSVSNLKTKKALRQCRRDFEEEFAHNGYSKPVLRFVHIGKNLWQVSILARKGDHCPHCQHGGH